MDIGNDGALVTEAGYLRQYLNHRAHIDVRASAAPLKLRQLVANVLADSAMRPHAIAWIAESIHDEAKRLHGTAGGVGWRDTMALCHILQEAAARGLTLAAPPPGQPTGPMPPAAEAA